MESPMTDLYENSGGLNAPAAQSIVVAPHDSTALTLVTKALYVGVGGDVAVRLVGDTSDRLFKNVPNGGVLDVRASHVRATGTSATSIIGLC